jgi:hypothetical protein
MFLLFFNRLQYIRAISFGFLLASLRTMSVILNKQNEDDIIDPLNLGLKIPSEQEINIYGKKLGEIILNE